MGIFRFCSFIRFAHCQPRHVRHWLSGFPVFKPRSYPDYKRVLQKECSPSEKLHSSVPREVRIREDELRYILETYSNTRHRYRSLYPESTQGKSAGRNKEIIYHVLLQHELYTALKKDFSNQFSAEKIDQEIFRNHGSDSVLYREIFFMF